MPTGENERSSCRPARGGHCGAGGASAVPGLRDDVWTSPRIRACDCRCSRTRRVDRRAESLRHHRPDQHHGPARACRSGAISRFEWAAGAGRPRPARDAHAALRCSQNRLGAERGSRPRSIHSRVGSHWLHDRGRYSHRRHAARRGAGSSRGEWGRCVGRIPRADIARGGGRASVASRRPRDAAYQSPLSGSVSACGGVCPLH